MRPELDQTGDDFFGRVRLDGIVDVGVSKTRFERMILLLDQIDIELEHLDDTTDQFLFWD